MSKNWTKFGSLALSAVFSLNPAVLYAASGAKKKLVQDYLHEGVVDSEVVREIIVQALPKGITEQRRESLKEELEARLAEVKSKAELRDDQLAIVNAKNLRASIEEKTMKTHAFKQARDAAQLEYDKANQQKAQAVASAKQLEKERKTAAEAVAMIKDALANAQINYEIKVIERHTEHADESKSAEREKVVATLKARNLVKAMRFLQSVTSEADKHPKEWEQLDQLATTHFENRVGTLRMSAVEGGKNLRLKLESQSGADSKDKYGHEVIAPSLRNLLTDLSSHLEPANSVILENNRAKEVIEKGQFLLKVQAYKGEAPESFQARIAQNLDAYLQAHSAHSTLAIGMSSKEGERNLSYNSALSSALTVPLVGGPYEQFQGKFKQIFADGLTDSVLNEPMALCHMSKFLTDDGSIKIAIADLSLVSKQARVNKVHLPNGCPLADSKDRTLLDHHNERLARTLGSWFEGASESKYGSSFNTAVQTAQVSYRNISNYMIYLGFKNPTFEVVNDKPRHIAYVIANRDPKKSAKYLDCIAIKRDFAAKAAEQNKD